jgi:hypothetical protein
MVTIRERIDHVYYIPATAEGCHMVSRVALYEARRYGGSIVDNSSAPVSPPDGDAAPSRFFRDDAEARRTGRDIASREEAIRFYNQRLDTINAAIRERAVEQKPDASTYRRDELARYTEYKKEEQAYLDSLRSSLGPSQYSYAVSRAPRDYRSDLLHKQEYTDAQGNYTPPNPAGQPGKQYVSVIQQRQASARQSLRNQASFDDAQRAQAAQTPGIYRLSNGTAIVSGTQNGNRVPPQSSRTVYGFNLFDPSTRAAIQESAPQYKTAGALFYASQASYAGPAPPPAPKPEYEVRRKPLFFEPGVRKFGSFLSEAGREGVQASGLLGENTVLDPYNARRGIATAGRYTFGLVQGAGDYLAAEPRRAVAEATASTIGGEYTGKLLGTGVSEVAERYGTRAAGRAENILNIGIAGAGAASVIGKSPQEVGRSLPSTIGFGVGYARGYNALAGNSLNFESLRFTEPARGETTPGGFGAFARARTTANIREFGLPVRQQPVDVLFTAEARRSSFPGPRSYDVSMQAIGEPFSYRGRTVSPYERYTGRYFPASKETVVSLPEGRTYLSRANRQEVSFLESKSGVRGNFYRRYPVEYTIYDTKLRPFVTTSVKVAGGTAGKAVDLGYIEPFRSVNVPSYERTVNLGLTRQPRIYEGGRFLATEEGFGFRQSQLDFGKNKVLLDFSPRLGGPKTTRTIPVPNRALVRLAKPQGVLDLRYATAFQSAVTEGVSNPNIGMSAEKLMKAANIAHPPKKSDLAYLFGKTSTDAATKGYLSFGRRGSLGGFPKRNTGYGETETIFRPQSNGPPEARGSFGYAPEGLPSFKPFDSSFSFNTASFLGRASRADTAPKTNVLPRLSSASLLLPRQYPKLSQDVQELQRTDIRYVLDTGLVKLPGVTSRSAPVFPIVSPSFINGPPSGGKPGLPFVQGFVSGGVLGGGGIRRQYRYAPDIVSIAYNIRAKRGKRSGFLGLEARPILSR